jgi:lipopolysaccharide/colanic/teichoic acid biosynthesis glycosyltransferase
MHKVREPFLKRPLDLILSIFMLILSLLASLPIALAIKLEDRGPIFYRQKRWGRNGTRFRAYKFRTMVASSDREFGLKQATENDPRITKVGQVLRTMGLDELPQLLNIFRGEMSLIGPRPERPEFVRELTKEIPYYDIRHLVRPGITGWAQVNYPYGASVEDALCKLEYEP